MKTIEKIKAEIDKRYAEYREKMKSDDFTYYEGMADALDLFEQFLDTLESEKPMEHKAINTEIGRWMGCLDDKYCMLVNHYSIQDIKDTACHFAQWGAERQKEQDDRLVDIIYQQGIEKGKDDMKEQMLKEAVEGEVMDFSSKQPRPQVDVLLDPHKYHTGDKVRIIICKKED